MNSTIHGLKSEDIVTRKPTVQDQHTQSAVVSNKQEAWD